MSEGHLDVGSKRTQEFLGRSEFGKVAEIMIKTKMNTSYRLVYRLIELTLILPSYVNA